MSELLSEAAIPEGFQHASFVPEAAAYSGEPTSWLFLSEWVGGL